MQHDGQHNREKADWQRELGRPDQHIDRTHQYLVDAPGFNGILAGLPEQCTEKNQRDQTAKHVDCALYRGRQHTHEQVSIDVFMP